jgi:hypothetical protein
MTCGSVQETLPQRAIGASFDRPMQAFVIKGK